MTPEYIGYAVCFLFLEDGIEWSVWVNEAGVLVTQEPNEEYFQYPDYDEFMLAFPTLATEVKVIVMRQMSETIAMLQQV
jgi:hypothetical protein